MWYAEQIADSTDNRASRASTPKRTISKGARTFPVHRAEQAPVKAEPGPAELDARQLREQPGAEVGAAGAGATSAGAVPALPAGLEAGEGGRGHRPTVRGQGQPVPGGQPAPGGRTRSGLAAGLLGGAGRPVYCQPGLVHEAGPGPRPALPAGHLGPGPAHAPHGLPREA